MPTSPSRGSYTTPRDTIDWTVVVEPDFERIRFDHVVINSDYNSDARSWYNSGSFFFSGHILYDFRRPLTVAVVRNPFPEVRYQFSQFR